MPVKTGVDGAKECTQYLVNNYNFNTILDIGCGYCPYFDLFKNKIYTGIDVYNKNVLNEVSKNNNINIINDNILTHDFGNKTYDCVYSSHVIEHISNTEEYIRRLKSLVVDDGILCIIWPKPKPQIVGGHVHIFNPGLIFYNIVRVGIDCSVWKCLENKYSFCVVGKCKKVEDPKLIYCMGEIELLRKYFPFNAKHGFHGVTDVPTIHLNSLK